MSNSGYPPVAPQDQEFGKLVAYAGPDDSPGGTLIYYAVGSLIGGVLSCAAPFLLNPKPEDVGPLRMLFFSLGGLMLLAGGLMFALPYLFGSHQIILYENGLIERVEKEDRRIPLATVERVKLFEWYDDRFSPQTWNVVIVVRNGAELRFSSKLAGNSEQIIAFLRQKIGQVEQIPFRP